MSSRRNNGGGPIPSDRAWFDPRLIGLNLYYESFDYQDDPDSITRVANNSPDRWGLIFTVVSQPDAITVAPWSDVQATNGGWLVESGTPLRITLPDYGPLVMAEWYMAEGSASIVRVTEIIRRTRG